MAIMTYWHHEIIVFPSRDMMHFNVLGVEMIATENAVSPGQDKLLY